MKKIFLGLAVLAAFGCKKTSTTASPQVYNSAKGTSLSIAGAQWLATKSGSAGNLFGTVTLSLVGSTNADKVLVQTYGDGMISDEELVLDANKNFKSEAIVISFTHSSDALPTAEFEKSTRIRAIKASDTLLVVLNSGKLKY